MTNANEFERLINSNPAKAFYLTLENIKNNSVNANEMMKLAYLNEIKKCKSICFVSAPLNQNATQFVNYRLNHFTEYKTILTGYLKNNFSKDFLTNFGLPENYKLNSLKTILDNGVNFYYNFPYPNEFRNDLINNTKKHQLTTPQIYNTQNETTTQTYYIGKYKGQNVLFLETTKFNKITRKSGSYELGIFINGREDGYMMLYRLDYNPEEVHINKIKKGKPNTSENENNNQINDYKEYSSALYKAVEKSHIHIPDLTYSVLFPNSFSYDCKTCVRSYKNFTDMCCHMRNNTKLIATASPINNLSNTTYNVNDFIKNIEDNQTVYKSISDLKSTSNFSMWG